MATDRPPADQTFGEAGRMPVRIAHRAGNGRLALRRALAARVDWIEADVWLHRGRLVTRHDRSLWRLPVTYSRRSLSVSLLPALVLDRLLHATEGTETRVLIDLKGDNPSLPGSIVDVLQRRDARGRAALCGQEWGPIEDARRIDPEIEVIFSLGTAAHLQTYLERRADGTAPVWSSCNHRLLDPASIEQLKEAGSRIIAWTVDSEPRARQLVGWGVDGITSNRYDMLNRLRLPPSLGRPPGEPVER